MSAVVVSRGTTSRRVRPILFRKYLVEANSRGVKDMTRRILTAKNSIVTPGTFEGLNLETGRVRLNAPQAELRAQCTFESGRVRVVSVLSAVRRGDLFWVKGGRFGSRAASTQTLEVRSVRVARAQDMTDEEIWREGAQNIPNNLRRKSALARDWFAALWDDANGAGSWDANPWVWVYEYRVHEQQVDELISKQEG